MRIALAHTNPIIGDIAGNAAQARQATQNAREQGAELVVFPELTAIGYPPKDLLLKPTVIDECTAAVEELASSCVDIAAIIGYPSPSDQAVGRSLYNAAALCTGGRIVHRF